jgi:hypothetical protein
MDGYEATIASEMVRQDKARVIITVTADVMESTKLGGRNRYEPLFVKPINRETLRQ